MNEPLLTIFTTEIERSDQAVQFCYRRDSKREYKAHTGRYQAIDPLHEEISYSSLQALY